MPYNPIISLVHQDTECEKINHRGHGGHRGFNDFPLRPLLLNFLLLKSVKQRNKETVKKMKKIFITLAITIVAGIALGEISGAIPGIRQETGKNNPTTKKQTFLVIYKPGPAFLTGKPISEQPLKEHFKYMVGLYKSGVMRSAGPFEDNTGGAAVIEASTENEAKAVADNDPSVTSRIFVYEMHPWRLVSWDQYIKQ